MSNYVGHVDMIEMKAFLKLVILARMFKSKHENTRAFLQRIVLEEKYSEVLCMNNGFYLEGT